VESWNPGKKIKNFNGGELIMVVQSRLVIVIVCITFYCLMWTPNFYIFWSWIFKKVLLNSRSFPEFTKSISLSPNSC
jgi:hypothetical protein